MWNIKQIAISAPPRCLPIDHKSQAIRAQAKNRDQKQKEKNRKHFRLAVWVAQFAWPKLCGMRHAACGMWHNTLAKSFRFEKEVKV